jgi:hypothetical protein
VVVLPFQREAFASQALDLSQQSNQMQITMNFQDAAYQPADATYFNLTNLECHVFRVFDRQL